MNLNIFDKNMGTCRMKRFAQACINRALFRFKDESNRLMSYFIFGHTRKYLGVKGKSQG